MPKIGVSNQDKIEITTAEWARFEIWIEQLLYKLEADLAAAEAATAALDVRVTVLEP